MKTIAKLIGNPPYSLELMRGNQRYFIDLYLISPNPSKYLVNKIYDAEYFCDNTRYVCTIFIDGRRYNIQNINSFEFKRI